LVFEVVKYEICKAEGEPVKTQWAFLLFSKGGFLLKIERCLNTKYNTTQEE